MEYSFEICRKNREILAKFIEAHTLEQLNKIPAGFNNNIIWNIGHSVATQQLLTYALSGVTPPVSMDFINTYRKGTKPERDVTKEEVETLKKLLSTSLEQLESDYKKNLFTTFKEYTLSTTGGVLYKVEDAIQFNNFHEGLHLGCCIQLSRLVK